MSLKQGAHLGACRCLEDLRGRCVINDETGCWHKRQADGKPHAYRPGVVIKVFVHGVGAMPARRAAWLFARGAVPEGQFVTYRCTSHDCVNPAHLVLADSAKLGRLVAANGRAKTPAKTVNARRLARTRSATNLTPELAAWARESDQNQRDVAHALGCCQQRISDLRRGKVWRDPVMPGASVFAWRPAA